MIAGITGLVAGAAHVWAGPDHLATIAPLAVHNPRRAWVPGIRWGLGHSAGVALVGLLSLWLRELLPVDLLSHWGERLVGVTLLGVGLWTLRLALRNTIHTHEHEHDGVRHVHLHAHNPVAPHNRPHAHRHHHAAFGFGTLHGLAGSSHLLGVLPMLAFPTYSQALMYLFSFAAGTVLSMAAFSWLMGWLASRCASKGIQFYRGLLGSAALAAMIVGGFWLATGFA